MIENEFKTYEVSDGQPFNPYRNRFDGTLSPGELAFCRQNAIAVAFDPAQQGWVTLDCEDDAGSLMTARSSRDRSPSQTPAACSFRRWTKADLMTYRALLDDPGMWAHLPETYPDPLDVETAQTLIDISNAGLHHDVRAVEFDGNVVGQVRLAFDNDATADSAETAELSYWVGRRFWGRGIAKEAIARFSEQAFRQYPALKEIFAVVDDGNTASVRALVTCGYQRSGVSDKVPGATVYKRSRVAS